MQFFLEYPFFISNPNSISALRAVFCFVFHVLLCRMLSKADVLELAPHLAALRQGVDDGSFSSCTLKTRSVPFCNVRLFLIMLPMYTRHSVFLFILCVYGVSIADMLEPASAQPSFTKESTTCRGVHSENTKCPFCTVRLFLIVFSCSVCMMFQ